MALEAFEGAKKGVEDAPSDVIVVVFKTYKRVPLGLGKSLAEVIKKDAKLNSTNGYTPEKVHLYSFRDIHQKTKGQKIAGIELKACHLHFFRDKKAVSDFEWPGLYVNDSDASDSEYEAVAEVKKFIDHPKYKEDLDKLKELFVEEVIKQLHLQNALVFTLLKVSQSGSHLQVSVSTLSGELCDVILEDKTKEDGTTVLDLKEKISNVRELQIAMIRVVSEEGEVLPDEFRLRKEEIIVRTNAESKLSKSEITADAVSSSCCNIFSLY